jgi:lysozyme
MKTSEQGVELIKDREGVRYVAYLDSVGVPTIGVGHTAGVRMGDTCDDAQAMAWLADDLKWSEAAVNKVWVDLAQHQFDALVSFVFNVGQGAFANSTLLRALNNGHYDEVPHQLDRWHIPPEITSRRNGEREQWKGTMFVARVASNDPSIAQT